MVLSYIMFNNCSNAVVICPALPFKSEALIPPATGRFDC